ncbi:MAG TPA: sigma-70 family RNA polymerase sigma factor [Geobacteraceae bacterium]
MNDIRRHIPDDDGELVLAARTGDLAAFELIVRKYQGRMLNVAFRITGVYEDACEVVQDAFVAAHRGLKDFRGESRFSTWLTAITANLARNRLEQLLTRRKNEALSLDDPLPTEDGDIMREPPSTRPTPLEEVERLNVQEKVQGCIGELPPGFREVLVLRDLEEFSYGEIGAILKLRDGTVKSRLARAREAVKDCLKRAFGAL